MRISGSTVIAPGVSPNLLQGLVGSIIRDPSSVDFFAVTDATDGRITASLQIDAESVLINGGIPAGPGVGQGPRDPEDVVVRNEAGPPGSILTLTFTNSGAATPVRWAVNVNPLV